MGVAQGRRELPRELDRLPGREPSATIQQIPQTGGAGWLADDEWSLAPAQVVDETGIQDRGNVGMLDASRLGYLPAEAIAQGRLAGNRWAKQLDDHVAIEAQIDCRI